MGAQEGWWPLPDLKPVTKSPSTGTSSPPVLSRSAVVPTSPTPPQRGTDHQAGEHFGPRHPVGAALRQSTRSE